MSGTANIMQEYLVKLGFSTDAISLRRFEDTLGATGKRVLKLGTVTAGVIATVEAATAKFAYAMREAYFQAELSKTSTKSLNEMAFAGKQVGLGADGMASAIKNLARIIDTSPGIKAMLEGYGIQTVGRDMADVAVETIRKFSEMPAYIGAPLAERMGIDYDTFKLMGAHLDEFIAKREKAKEIYKASGLDPDSDEYKKLIKEYTEALDTLELRLKVAGQRALLAVMPASKFMAEWVGNIADAWSRILNGEGPPEGSNGDEFLKWLGIRSIKKKPGERDKRDTGIKPIGPTLEEQKQLEERNKAAPSTGPVSLFDVPGKATWTQKRMLSNLEDKYNLPPGVLYGMWGAESLFGKKMKSGAGALGHFQFMPETAEQYGIAGKEMDFGASSDAAARYIKDLLKWSKGDLRRALRAYNFGQGNMEKVDRGERMMPEETFQYPNQVDKYRSQFTGVPTVNQTNNVTISVNGTEAEATARAVAKQQDKVLGDATRMLRGSMR